MSEHFCRQCGTQVIWREIENRQREVCPKCGWIHYEQLKVGAGVIIEQDGKLLLCQRGHNPWKGNWNIPAGYAEANEAPAHTAVREAQEETGLQIETVRQLATYYYDDDPRGNGITILFQGRIIGGEIKTNPESVAIKYFDRQDLPASFAGGGHDQAIIAWANYEFQDLVGANG